jgi:hypothetical protein
MNIGRGEIDYVALNRQLAREASDPQTLRSWPLILGFRASALGDMFD